MRHPQLTKAAWLFSHAALVFREKEKKRKERKERGEKFDLAIQNRCSFLMVLYYSIFGGKC